jgi:hypothetical protein
LCEARDIARGSKPNVPSHIGEFSGLRGRSHSLGPTRAWCRRNTAFIVFSETAVALFKLPLSGDVVQWINPVTWFASGNQISTNVYLGESSSPETEAEILDRVGTYGRQLGQITDAIIVLVKHLPDHENLPRKENDVLKAFEKMANDIADIKEKHKRQAVRP